MSELTLALTARQRLRLRSNQGWKHQRRTREEYQHYRIL